MRLDGYWVLDFPDTRLQECVTRMKEAIEARLADLGATTVLTHTDIDIHGDHRAVYAATREAARDVPVVLSYEDVSTPNEFVPNYYVDITDYVEDELKLVSFHRTQAHREYMDPEVIKGRAAHRGLQSGVTYAEAFRAHRIIQ
jgi:LmbE family N-acetylglucosaminyl deacetylase